MCAVMALVLTSVFVFERLASMRVLIEQIEGFVAHDVAEFEGCFCWIFAMMHCCPERRRHYHVFWLSGWKRLDTGNH